MEYIIGILIGVVVLYIILFIKEKIFVTNLTKNYFINYSYKDMYPHIYLNDEHKKIYIYRRFRLKPLVYNYSDLKNVKFGDKHEKVLVSNEKNKHNFQTMVGIPTNDGVIVGTSIGGKKNKKTIVQEKELYSQLVVVFEFKDRKLIYNFIRKNTLNDNAQFQKSIQKYNNLMNIGSYILNTNEE